MSSSTAEGSDNNNICRLTKDFDLLRQSALFSGLHLDLVKLFAYLSVRKTFRQGDRLIEQGEKADKAYILNEGVIEVSVTHKGTEVTLQRLGKDDFFGELALLAQFDWFFSATAVTDVEVLVLDRIGFQKVLEKYPDHKNALIERVIQLRVDRLVDQTSFMLDRMEPADTTSSTSLI